MATNLKRTNIVIDPKNPCAAIVGKITDPYSPSKNEMSSILSLEGAKFAPRSTTNRFQIFQRYLNLQNVACECCSWRAEAEDRLSLLRHSRRTVYIDTHAAFAKGDLNALQDLVTENIFLVCGLLSLILVVLFTHYGWLGRRI